MYGIVQYIHIANHINYKERVYLGQKDSIHDQIAWDFGDVHYFADAKDGGPLTCQYVFVLDALNFCFWPTPEYVRKVRELGAGLARYFDGWALNVVRASNFSAVECLRLVLAHFPADYRVPQVLRPEGVLQYSLALDALIQAKTPIPSGSLMEVEIRACTIQAVEQLHAVLTAKGHRIKVIELDWLLWQIGENAKDHLPNHHRTWSVFY
ncbi:hypothetical protein DYB28_009757 [Aphanomyces astaci]|uniref:Queuosine 5'-phosphate N-glycosylase/hydrolase n=1 Tax=Aphanomyces astaci TaxID=112090 RepID=A0A9X8H237_APHAT|nr:hypothetical protein DYB28_009757 [Aphanomyces astaci]